MNKSLRAGKGLHITLTDEVADWMSDVMYAVYEAFGSAATYMRPEEVVEELRSRLSTDDGWEFEQDKYGVKMVNVLELDDGELRVAVVVNKSGELRLDIRSWFDPEVN